MGRIRTIKPEAFLDEELWDLEQSCGLPLFRAFSGLWCQADREGRFEWRPRKLKAAVLPYWDGDFSRVLDALTTRGFVQRYAVDGREYGVVRTFTRHQVVNNRETESVIPAPPADLPRIPPETPPNGGFEASNPRVNDACSTREVHARVEGKGREQEGKGTEGSAPAGAHAILPSTVPTPDHALESGASRVARRLNAKLLHAWDLYAWRNDLEAIAAKPEAELERVLEGLAADPWIREKRSRANPAHIRKHWAKYLDPEPPRLIRGPMRAPTLAEFRDTGDDFPELAANG